MDDFSFAIEGPSSIFKAIGMVVSAFVAYKVSLGFIFFILKHFFGKLIGLPANIKKAGAWAVVTGCTDGIGKAYAEQLAAKGFNVVLISRTKSKLDDMANSVESTYKVKTKVIAADMSKEDVYDVIKTGMDGLDIGVLVNNVGCSYDHPEYFGEVDDVNIVSKMIHMNCTSVAKMTQIVLPGMVVKGRGFIINIGSSAGSKPAPLLALYSATKAYVEMFTRSLYEEYREKGVTFQYVKPFFVVSKLSKFRSSSVLVPSPTTFVKNALSLVGVENSTTGYWAHELQENVVKFFTDTMMFNMMKKTRTLALKKKKAASKSD